jgi:Transglutaminase-like superfamily
MSDEAFRAGNRTVSKFAAAASQPAPLAAGEWTVVPEAIVARHRLFWLATYIINFLFLSALFGVVWTTVWEYSTRRYLKGFSDAIIPATASPEEKIQSILDWISRGPSRLTSGFAMPQQDRDPTDTLNYQSLLRVCGTATNAFINLANSGGLPARRILLLDAYRRAKHVDAEVLVNGHWIVVDPAFRAVLRGPNGRTLTREQLADPAVFAAATRNIPKYDPGYSFESTAHVRISRIGLIGRPLRSVLHFLAPGWGGSATMSLILERESFAAMIGMILIALCLGVIRVSLRWYGEKRLEVHPVRIRQQLRRAFQAFFSTAS